MKRLSLVQALSTADEDPDHLAYLKSTMHRRLVTEARKRGMKLGPMTWSDHFVSAGDEEEPTIVIRVIELTMDAS